MEKTNRYLYQEKVEELEITLDTRNNTIDKLKEQIKELKTSILSYEMKNKNLKYNYELLEIDFLQQKKRLVLADYYENLIKIIDKNPSIQGEWVKFMTYIKLFTDPEEIKGL